MKKSILLLFVLPVLVFLGSYSGGNLISYFGSISQMKYDGSKSLYDGDMNTTLNDVIIAQNHQYGQLALQEFSTDDTLMDIASCGIFDLCSPRDSKCGSLCKARNISEYRGTYSRVAR